MEQRITARVSDAALVLGATMRLTRVVVSDDIGQWWIHQPVDRAMQGWCERHKAALHVHLEGDQIVECRPWWWKYRDGLDCPFCVGFHVGWLVMASYLVSRRVGLIGPWRFVAGALTLNHVAAHLGSRLGDAG